MTGKNIYGEDIGLTGRAFALASALPGGKIAGKLVKAIRKVDDVAEVAVKQSTKRTADLAQKAVRHGDHALEAVGDATARDADGLAEWTVWSDRVVFLPPSFNEHIRFEERIELLTC